MLYGLAESETRPVLGAAVLSAAGKSKVAFPRASVRVTGLQADGQAAVWSDRKEVYKVAVKDTSEVK